MKLVHILKEFLLEKNIIRVPSEELNKINGLYDDILRYWKIIYKNSPKEIEKAFSPAKYKNYFDLVDYFGKPFNPSVVFYNDDEDKSIARGGDNVYINLAYFPDTKNDFYSTMHHELVHTKDPKVTKPGVYKKMYPKKGAEPTGIRFNLSKSDPKAKSEFQKNYEKYLKSPWEFDAYIAPMIEKLKNSSEKTDKSFFKKIMLKLFSDLKTKSVRDIIDDPELSRASFFFSNVDWSDEENINWDDLRKDFEYDLSIIKIWSTKPTLYKMFLKKFANEVL